VILQDFTQNSELGQVWTPNHIALQMAKLAMRLCPNANNILDPACGPATFSNALYDAGARSVNLFCYDVDKRMVEYTRQVNTRLKFQGQTNISDYMADDSLVNKFDIVIMNPPYIRQELIIKDEKEKYHKFLSSVFKAEIHKKANLFALFLLKGLADLRPGGILSAVVYDAITQAGYGKLISEIMSSHGELISSQHVKTPFQGVLVDAQILVFRKRKKPLITTREVLSRIDTRFSTLDDLLHIRRGTGFPLRRLFFAKPDDPYFERAKPFFVKQAKLSGLVIRPDQRAYLLEADQDDELRKWLEERAMENSVINLKTSIRGIKGPIIFNYYLRNSPRHLWNPANIAVADNFYVSSPKIEFPTEVAWLLLNSKSYLSRIIKAARNQGNGLLKLQLYEYKSVSVPNWNLIPKTRINGLSKIANSLIKNRLLNYFDVRNCADQATKGIFND